MAKTIDPKILDVLEREAMNVLIVVDAMREVTRDLGQINEKAVKKKLRRAALTMGPRLNSPPTYQ